MAKNIKGEWVKYEKEPGKWNSEDSSYTRLCEDLKQYKNTGWSLSKLADHIYGEFMPSEGIGPSDVYIYYVVNKNKRVPKLCLIHHKYDDEEFYVRIYGTERKIEPGSKEKTVIPKAEYLSIILDKLKELSSKEGAFKEEEEKLAEYQELIRISKEGVKTPYDILTIYRNFTRIDTYISKTLVKGRNVQNDYDSLSEELKAEFVNILSNMSIDDSEALAKLTDAEGQILTIESIDVLKNAASSVGLKCLRYANREYLNNKEKLLEILSMFDIEHSNTIGIDYISEELQTDVDVLHAIVRTHPSELFMVIINLIEKIGKKGNELLKARLKDREYMLRLLDDNYRNVIGNPSYVKEAFIPDKILDLFTPEMLENVENEILYGPFATAEEEQMKTKVSEVIKSERIKIRDYRKEQTNN